MASIISKSVPKPKAAAKVAAKAAPKASLRFGSRAYTESPSVKKARNKVADKPPVALDVASLPREAARTPASELFGSFYLNGQEYALAAASIPPALAGAELERGRRHLAALRRGLASALAGGALAGRRALASGIGLNAE